MSLLREPFVFPLHKQRHLKQKAKIMLSISRMECFIALIRGILERKLHDQMSHKKTSEITSNGKAEKIIETAIRTLKTRDPKSTRDTRP